jgi:hypothetical protein
MHCSGLSSIPRKQLSRFLNEAIDRALTDPPKQLLDDLQPLVRLQKTEALADRVRRRATALVRSGRAHADTIMSTRDQIILTLYHAASPVGCELVIKLLLGADTNHNSVFPNDNRPGGRSFDP